METDQDSTEKLREEILIDAKNDREKIIIRARQEAEVILSNATAEADRVQQEQLDHAGKEASRQSELVLATVHVETGSLRAKRIEALLGSLYEEASRRLQAHEGFEYRDTVIVLASQAISQMTGTAFVVRLSDAEQSILGDSLAAEIAQRVGRSVSVNVQHEPGIEGSGVVVETGDARQVWDNRFTKRLERLWPELRRQIAVEANFVPTHINIGEVK